MTLSGANALTRVLTGDSVAALTFDDGPDPVHTPRLLDILAAHGAQATFFMIGARAQRHPELVRRVAAEGHAIGNHSWNHPSFPFISREERREQVQACARAISPYGEKLFRPPYGHQNRESWLDVARMGYRIVAWKVDAEDWGDHDGPSIADLVMAQLRPGAVVLLHDGLFDAPDNRFPSREFTVSAVEIVLDRLNGSMQFVTIPKLLQHGRPHLSKWNYLEDKEELNRLTCRDGTARRY